MGVTVVNAMSKQLEQEVRNLGLSNAGISRISNGVIVPPAREDLVSSAGPVRIAFIGRLVEQKGLWTLLAASRFLRDAGIVFELRILGGGPLQSSIENKVRELELNGCVELVGPILPEQVTEELSRADLFVLPSLFEGMPGALLEAIAHGLPAVVTQVSGSEDIIDDSIGWLVPVGDPHALATAIGDAINMGREELKRMGTLAREKAVHEYDIDFVAKTYLRLFENLLEHSPSITHT